MKSLTAFAGLFLTLVTGSATITDNPSAIQAVRDLFTADSKPLSVDASEVELWKFIPDLLQLLGDKNSQIETQGLAVNELTKQRNAATQDIERLSGEHDSLKSQLKTDVERLTNQVMSATKEIDQLQEQLTAAREQAIQTADENAAEVLRLQTEMANKQQVLNSAHQSLTASQTEVATLTTKKQNLQDMVTQLTSELQRGTEEAVKAAEELVVLQEQLRTQTDLIERIQRRAGEDAIAHKDEMERLTKTATDAEAGRLEQTERAEMWRERAGGLERDLVNVRGDHQSYLDKTLAIENENTALLITKAALTKENEDLIQAASGNPTNTRTNSSKNSGAQILKGVFIGAGSVLGLVAISLAIYKFRLTKKTSNRSTRARV